ncbi:Peptidoglycan-N-acetylglucosamine deacetylase [compost metagenome]
MQSIKIFVEITLLRATETNLSASNSIAAIYSEKLEDSVIEYTPAEEGSQKMKKRNKGFLRLHVIAIGAVLIVGGYDGVKWLLLQTGTNANAKTSIVLESKKEVSTEVLAPASTPAATMAPTATPSSSPGTQNTTKEQPLASSSPPVKATDSPKPKSEPADSAAHGAEAKLVALTFDDGPDAKYTPQVLDILAENKVKATFFVVGKQVSVHAEVLQQIHDAGHAIGNHSWGHPNMSKMSSAAFIEEVEKTNQVIKDVLGSGTPLFRAPYGATSKELIQTLKTNGYNLINWNVDTRDWDGTSSDQIVLKVKQQTKAGGIILMHSFGGKNGDLDNTIKALPQIIAYLKEHGYTLVTIPELLSKPKK